MKKLITVLCFLLLMTSCTPKQDAQKPEISSIYYEIFVGSFYDTDEDGMGDLEGVRQKLDYIQKDLGATGIWLMPINPSPTYHKYDVEDYKAIDPTYGDMKDFDNLIDEMQVRDMDLILDLVLNHTSSTHPWFKKAKAAQIKGDCAEVVECDFYNFSSSYESGYHKIKEDLYYEGGFWSEMPDLNLDNELVKEHILDTAKFWLDKGVKGFRLDATTHFFNDSQKNIDFLKWFNTEVKNYKEDAYIVSEAWTSEAIIADMYASQIDSFFNFSFSQNSGKLYKSMRSGSGSKLSQDVESYQKRIQEKNPNAIDAPFISNHDNNRSSGYLVTLEDQKMAASIYLLMPGNPFIYYGEEIGLKGSGIDENKRLAMIWDSKDKKGETVGPKDSDYITKEQLSVHEALKDKNSLLNHYKHVISLRNAYPDISRGIFESIDLGEPGLYGSRQNNTVVVHNLSDEPLAFELAHKKIKTVLGKYSNKGTIITIEPKSSIIIEE